MFSSYFFYAKSISNIFRFFSELLKCPFTYWLNARCFLQIVDIGNFNMKLTGRWFPQIVEESISNIFQTKIVVLASEPVGGRSQVTELPCFSKQLFGDDGDQLSRDGFYWFIRKVICKLGKAGLAHFPIIMDIIQ